MNGGEHVCVPPNVVASSVQLGFHFDYAIVATLDEGLDDSFRKTQVIFGRVFLTQKPRQPHSRVLQTGDLLIQSLLILEALTELFATLLYICLQLFKNCFVIDVHVRG